MVVLRDKEVARLHFNDGIHLRPAAYRLTQPLEVTYHIILDCPLIECVVGNRLCSEARFHHLVLKFFKRKLIAVFRHIVVARHVGNHTRCHLQLYVGAIFHLLVAHPLVGIFYSFHIGWRNHIRSQDERKRRDYRCRHKIRHHQSPEADSARQHRDNLGVVGKFRREEYHRNKSEQRAELIGKVRQEVHEVVENRLLQRSREHCIKLLVDVKHHHNGKKQHD